MFRFQISFIGSVDVVNSFMDMCTSFYIYIFQRLIQFPADNAHLSPTPTGSRVIGYRFQYEINDEKNRICYNSDHGRKIITKQVCDAWKNEYLSLVISICGYEI